MSIMHTTLLSLSLLLYGSYAQSSSNPGIANFSAADTGFYSVFGPNPTITLLHNASDPLFHEAAIYHAQSDSLFVTSNRVTVENNPATANQTIYLNRVTNVSSTDISAIRIEPLSTDNISMPNGGINYPTGSQLDQSILLCSQGTLNQTSGLFAIPNPITAPNVSIPVVTDFYSRQFNSPNDIAINVLDGNSIWFTDPTYGYQQKFRPAPVLPSQVYRYHPQSNTTRVVADGFVETNGLTFSHDYSTLYVTDTGASDFKNGNGPATIYAFDVTYPGGKGPFLTNRRVFAYAPAGLPDGVRTDDRGYVYAGTGIGLTVWDGSGTLLGNANIQGGAANFALATIAQKRYAFIMGEKLLWRVQYDL